MVDVLILLLTLPYVIQLKRSSSNVETKAQSEPLCAGWGTEADLCLKAPQTSVGDSLCPVSRQVIFYLFLPSLLQLLAKYTKVEQVTGTYIFIYIHTPAYIFYLFHNPEHNLNWTQAEFLFPIEIDEKLIINYIVNKLIWNDSNMKYLNCKGE